MQVAYLPESPATIERELVAFDAVRDAYPGCCSPSTRTSPPTCRACDTSP